ncbi:MAG: hypothetical protein U0441_24925 [Polyangiaceae bacterium]
MNFRSFAFIIATSLATITSAGFDPLAQASLPDSRIEECNAMLESVGPLLNAKEVALLTNAIVKGGLANSRDALLAGVRAAPCLPKEDTPLAQILSDINWLNARGRGASGAPAIVVYMKNAHLLLGDPSFKPALVIQELIDEHSAETEIGEL